MLYIDSADRTQIAPLLATGMFDGVTTNPLILHRSGLNSTHLPELAQWLRENGSRRLFAQATGSTVEELRACAGAITALGDDVVVKFVCTREALSVAKELTTAGREVLITAVYHPAQMLLAAAAGAHYIAPYVGRATDAGRSGLGLVNDMAQMTIGGPRILAASLRSLDQLARVGVAGANDATLSIELANALFDEDLTRTATAEFEAIAQGSISAA